MPGGEDSYHLLRAKDDRSNSKADTFFIRPRGVGSPDKQVESFHTERIQGDVTGGAGEITDLTGDNLGVSDGALVASGGAPTDASYVTTSAEADLSDETVATDLRSVYGSPVEVGGADLQLSTGRGITSADTGNTRLSIGTNNTSLRNQDGQTVLFAQGGAQTALFATSDEPVRISDQQGGFTAAEYTTSGSSPGTLSLPGATLDMSNEAVTNVNSLNGGGPVSEGDGTERQIWVIANGASDPAGADPEDIIFEEES